MNVDGDLAGSVFGAEGYGHSPAVASALNRLWATMSSDYGLVPQLAYDAIVARHRQ